MKCSPAIIGFAHTLLIKRGNSDGAGKAAHAFLEHITGELWLLAAMMSDASAATMNLIRYFDDETLTIVELCERIDHFLAHITWMFFSDGVFSIDSHTKFVVNWYEGSPHHFVVGGVGRSIGGIPVGADVRSKCSGHLQSSG